jgi:tryptophan synthase alpha chain
MSRITERFAQLKAGGRRALIPYITAGDPEPRVTVPLLHALVAAGADVLELGVPFSDPMADGPVIQQAAERALKHHVGLRQVLDMVREFRATDAATPVVLMGYLNPIEAMGYRHFARAAAEAGVDGVLTVDLPPEEADGFLADLKRHDIDPIFLLAPTSSPARIARIVAAAGGFVYYVSLRGVTGAAHIDMNEVAGRVKAIRALTALPVGVGFGINSPEAAAQVARFADAVVVGSAIVKRIAGLVATPDAINAALGEFVAALRAAIDAPGAGRPARKTGVRA